MKGATALPWLKTRSPPRSTSTTMTGQSQNFFRANMNARISRTVSMVTSEIASELVLHTSRRWAGGLPFDPVRRRERLESELQDVVAERSPHPGEWRDNAVEDDRHEHERHHRLAHRSERHPRAVDRAKPGGPDEREQKERRCHREGPRPHRVPAQQRHEADDDRADAEHESHRAVRRDGDLFVHAAQIMMHIVGGTRRVSWFHGRLTT